MGAAQRDNPLVLYPAEVEALRRPERIRTYDWMQAKMRVAAGPFRGQLWRPEHTPYAEGIMDAWDDPAVRKIFLLAVPQTGKTTIAYGCLLASQDQDPQPCGVGMPDEKTLRRVLDEKLAPMVRAVASLRGRLDGRHATEGTDINFRGGNTIYGMWSGSEASQSATSMARVVIDEEDAYTDRHAVGSQETRVGAYEALGLSKILRCSQPRGMKGESSIWQAAQTEAQVWRRWQSRCPACGEYQLLDDKSLVVLPYEDGSVETDPKVVLAKRLARYKCCGCGYLWSDEARRLAIRAGRWHADRQMEGELSIVAYHLTALDSPLKSQQQVLYRWLTSKDDPYRRRRYDNDIRGVPSEVVVSEVSEDRVLALRDQAVAPRTVPGGEGREDIFLTCGIDMQRRSFWFAARCWTMGLESWLVDYGELGTWGDVGALVHDTAFPVLVGGDVQSWVRIVRAGLDTGGTREDDAEVSRTEEAYEWLRWQGRGVVWACKGASRVMDVFVRRSVIDKLPSGKAIPGGLQLMIINADRAKEAIHYRMSAESTQPWRLHRETGEDYAAQLLAERKTWDNRKRRYVWKGSRNNHLLDCEAINCACVAPEWHPSLQLLVRQRRLAEQEAQQHKPVGKPKPQTRIRW